MTVYYQSIVVIFRVILQASSVNLKHNVMFQISLSLIIIGLSVAYKGTEMIVLMFCI